MSEKIKVIIADDNVVYCKSLNNYFEKNNKVEVIGIANTDVEEIRMIDELRPQVVITDLKRNNEYSGLDIIKKYSNNENSPLFIVASGDVRIDMIRNLPNVANYVHKPFSMEELLKKIIDK